MVRECCTCTQNTIRTGWRTMLQYSRTTLVTAACRVFWHVHVCTQLRPKGKANQREKAEHEKAQDRVMKEIMKRITGPIDGENFECLMLEPLSWACDNHVRVQGVVHTCASWRRKARRCQTKCGFMKAKWRESE